MKRIKFNIEIPEDIKFIHNIFKENGLELYLVGGCVRDSFLKLKIKDYDLSTNANPDEVMRLMDNSSGMISLKALPIGEQFGVINVVTGLGNQYEIATWRSDGVYTDSRRPDSVTFGSLELDSKRRDLTINSLYYDIESGEVLDFNDGVSDLENKIIRTVGNTIERIYEDKLRVLRFVRFKNRYRFKYEEHLEDILETNIELTGVSKERIRNEFLSTLNSAKNKSSAIEDFVRFGFINQIFPMLDINLKKPKVLVNSSPIVIISYLLRKNDLKKLSTILNQITYSKTEVQLITFLVSLLKFTEEDIITYKKKINNLDIYVSDVKRFTKINRLSEKLIKGLVLYDLKVNGDDVKKEFGLNGEALGLKIKELEVEHFKNFIRNDFK